jgi:4-hydroxy-tetrahydrodipicolinate reductase
MPIRVLVNGAEGKMGNFVVKAVSAAPDFTLVGQTGRIHDLMQEIKNSQPQVVVDFTQAESAYKNTRIIIEAGACPVIGTTGLLKKQITDLQQQCEELKLGGVVAPNFSLGAVLMMKYAKAAARYFPHVEIIEMHHNGKLDSPSGTAVRSAELIAEARLCSPKFAANTHETVPGARGALYQEIPIHSVRLPGLVAHQQIIFGSLGETLTFRHDSIDRQCFMPGVLLACQKVLQLDRLVYGLEELMGD